MCFDLEVMRERVVEPEILDSLPKDDLEAVGSRRDLRRINFLMGNERWILDQDLDGGVVELGAGGGELTRKLAKRSEVVGLDLVGRPESLGVGWVEGDLFETLPEVMAETVVGNLILHHFRDDDLERLGGLMRMRRRVVFVEPWRSGWSLALGRALCPFVNRVTRHDMLVSVRAGFRKGELPALLGMGEGWDWREEISVLGGIRVLGIKR